MHGGMLRVLALLPGPQPERAAAIIWRLCFWQGGEQEHWIEAWTATRVSSHSPASRPSLWEVLCDAALNLCHKETGSVGLEVRRVLPRFVCE